MFRALIFLSVLSLAIGCGSTSSNSQGKLTESAVLNAWFEDLDRENFMLHDTLLEALFISRQTGKTVFVLRVTVEEAETPPRLYRVSLERGFAMAAAPNAARPFREQKGTDMNERLFWFCSAPPPGGVQPCGHPN